MLASKETNKPVHNTKQIGLFQRKSPKQRDNTLSSHTHWSDLPYCIEPVYYQILIPYSNCHVLGQPVLL